MKILLYFLLFTASLTHAKEDPAMIAVKSEADAFMAEVATEQDVIRRHPPFLKKLIRDHFVPLVDEEYMARQILGNHWKRASFSQQQAFMTAFREKILATYASAFSAYYGKDIQFKPAQYSDKRKKALVEGVIRNNGNTVRVDFRLYKIRQQWKVYDIMINGMSLTRSFREQVARNIDQQGLAQTVSILNKEYQDETPVLRFGAQSWGPYMGPGLPNQGLAINIVAQAFAQLGYRTEITFLSGPSIDSKTDEGQLVGDVAVWQSENPDTDYFYSAPYLANELVFVKRSTDPFVYQNAQHMKTFIQGKGYRLGLYEDVDYGSAIKKKLSGFVIDRRDYCSQLIRDVANKSLDVALLDHWAGSIEMKQTPAVADHLTMLNTPIGERLMHLRVKRTAEDADVIIDAFNTGLSRIRDNGTYAELLKLHKYSQ